jgi:NAD(P)-dependent dehydrogenase (short-subunit alcohol dehydrogenase family)
MESSDMELGRKQIKSVLVTGASSGIGQAIALRMSEAGWRVYAGVRKADDALRLNEMAGGGKLTPLFLDVTNESSIASARAHIELNLGIDGLDGLVNNAGIPLGGPLEFLDIQQFRSQLEVNVLGVVAVTQAFLPLLRSAGGRIVNIGSIHGRVALPLYGPYAASKHALVALTESLRVEVAPWGMRVILVEPGDTVTAIWRKIGAMVDAMPTTLPQEAFELYGPLLTIRERFIQHGMAPEKVAVVVERALVSRRARFRYLVGWDALGFACFSLLPATLRDRIVASRLPKYRRDAE